MEQQPTQPRELESDKMNNSLRCDESEQPTEYPTQLEGEGSERVSLEFNGIKIAMNSARIDVSEVVSLVYHLYTLLKDTSSKDKGGSYIS